MAPLSKVSLLEGNENCEDGSSGPYSMLFIDQKNETYTRDTAEDSLDDTLNQTVIEVSLENRRRTITKNNTTTVLQNGSDDITYVQNELNSEKDNKQELFTIDDNHRRSFKEQEVHKSCENFFNELGVEVKRRRTITKLDNNTIVLSSIEKPSSLPQLRTSQNFSSFDFSLAALSKLSHSTPVRGEFEESLLRKLQTTNLDDDSNKRDSLEFEESLGILTPEQMIDASSYMSVINSRTPSSECIVPSPGLKTNRSELPSPNLVDGSTTDFSLGIIDEKLLSNLTTKTDPMNMELLLDTKKDFTLSRPEQTPSPEDLPLDPTPIVKTEPSKSKTSSFITSITSITSLDTGYQGDGEMSRPASRGADNSPLTRRPLPRPQTRRPDPMTDSDFYTESDADNHEENPLRGDRRAQVIDGTLYGVDPQAAADIYVNNRENMDSSGIFTDIESSNTRNDEDVNNLTTDVSPSDTSTKTISGNSQNNIQEILEKATIVDDKDSQKENPKKRNAPSPVVSSPSSVRSPRHKEENASKKFKLPKREVPSKVKAMLESSPQPEKKILKKPVGRWDAVMNKISKTEQTKTNLKDVKSKVFNNVNVQRAPSVRQTSSQKSPNTKL